MFRRQSRHDLIQTRPQALGAAKLARTQRALRRFIKVFEQAIAARRSKGTARR